MTAALEGLRVLDLTRYIPGPYCAMLLGDLGADVVKIEAPPAGDPTRGLPPAAGDDSAAHAALNRNKRSLAVDLRAPEGAEAVRRLAARADVLLETFRPGTLGGWGLGPERLLEANPRLVYCSLTGYGQQGEHSSRAGHDIDYLAVGGFLGGNRDRGGDPVLPIAQVADMTGALVATIGILSALQARERTGRGQHVDASMLAGVAALMTLPAARHRAGPGPADELAGAYPCYRLYRCRDGGHLAVGALEPKFWARLCHALDLPEHVGHQWDAGERGREAIAAFERAFAGRDRDQWVPALRAVDACVEPVLGLDEAYAAGPPACPIRLRDTPPSLRRPPPRFGEHTQEVLVEAGYSEEQISGMRRSGAVA